MKMRKLQSPCILRDFFMHAIGRSYKRGLFLTPYRSFSKFRRGGTPEFFDIDDSDLERKLNYKLEKGFRLTHTKEDKDQYKAELNELEKISLLEEKAKKDDEKFKGEMERLEALESKLSKRYIESSNDLNRRIDSYNANALLDQEEDEMKETEKNRQEFLDEFQYGVLGKEQFAKDDHVVKMMEDYKQIRENEEEKDSKHGFGDMFAIDYDPNMNKTGEGEEGASDLESSSSDLDDGISEGFSMGDKATKQTQMFNVDDKEMLLDEENFESETLSDGDGNKKY